MTQASGPMQAAGKTGYGQFMVDQRPRFDNQIRRKRRKKKKAHRK